MTSQSFDLDRIGGAAVLRGLVDEVLSCGEEALELYRTGAASRAIRKPDDSPVTEADQRIEARLRAFLARRVPASGFLGEESGGEGSASLRFIVDPIDGTRAFMRGIPTWSILVGLEHEGVPVVGIAHMAAADDLFVAVRGEGATRNGRPLRVSEVSSLADACVSHGALSQFREAGCLRLLDDLAAHTYTQRGFADFDGYRQLLLGRIDAMVDPGVKPWDLCAPHVIVHEAGGRLTDFSGRDAIDGGAGLATNGHVHDALVALTSRYG